MRPKLEKKRKEQERIAEKVKIKDDFGEIKAVAGFDLAFSRERAFCSGVVLDYKTLEVLEKKASVYENPFPYIPTFLTFREAPAVENTYSKLEKKPDVVLINGQGIAHPLRCGSASHIGVLLGKPSLGVAQSRLVGEYKEPEEILEPEKLIYKEKQVGWVIKTKKNCNPVFVSSGHRVSVKSSLDIVRNCLKDHKLPEPLYLAHREANNLKRSSSELG